MLLLVSMLVHGQEISGESRIPDAPPSICNDIDIPPPELQPPGGVWWNPDRYGVGWQSVLKDEGGQRKMQMVWYTYRSDGRPIWYVSDWAAFNANGTWHGALHRSGPNGLVAPSIGELAVTVTSHPDRLALSWTRNHGGVTVAAPVSECVVDLLRSQPLNEPVLDRAVDSVYGGIWKTSPSDHRSLNFAMNNGGAFSQYVELLMPTLFDAQSNPVWLYAQYPNAIAPGSGIDPALTHTDYTHNIAYPFATYQPQNLCRRGVNGGCIEHIVLDGVSSQASATVLRRFDSPFSGHANINICSGTFDGNDCNIWRKDEHDNNYVVHTIRAWREPSSVSSTVQITKQDPHTAIEVDRYDCQAEPNQPTCRIRVSWAVWPTPQNISVWRTTGETCSAQGTTQLTGTTNSGAWNDDLPIWSTVRYQIRSGNSATGTVLACTPPVQAYGDLPDAAPANLGIPNHDPTVGALPGTAGVSGGAATYQIPIEVAPGRQGMQPDLALVYSSRSGNGIAGLGWSLSGLSSIHRCPQTVAQDGRNTAVDYSSDDRLCLDGRRLILVEGPGYGLASSVYHTEIDDFAKVTQLGGPIAPGTAAYFRVEHKNGQIDWYGACVNGGCGDNNARHRALGAVAQSPLSWALVSREDRVGNGIGQGNNIRYHYQSFGEGEYAISSIRYTGFQGAEGSRRVDFQYEARATTAGGQDVSSSYLSRGATFQRHRLRRVQVLAPVNQGENTPAVLFREYRLNYGSRSLYTGRSVLRSVQGCAFHDGTEHCRAATLFDWQDAAPGFDLKPLSIPGLPTAQALSLPTVPAGEDPHEALIRELFLEQLSPSERQAVEAGLLQPPRGATPENLTFEFRPLADITGDGALEWYARIKPGRSGHSSFIVRFAPDRQIVAVHPFTDITRFGGQGGPPPTDINNDGKAEIVGAQNDRVAFGFWSNQSATFTYTQTQVPSTNLAVSGGRSLLHVMDFDGDGKPDILAGYRGNQVSTVPAHGCSANAIALVLFRNTTVQVPPGSPTPPPTFSTTAQPVTCLQPYTFSGGLLTLNESIERISDFTGNGLPDIVILRPMTSDVIGERRLERIVQARANNGAIQFQSLPASSMGVAIDDIDRGRHGSTIVRWADVNGDGLDDLIIGAQSWMVRLNQGGYLGPRLMTANTRGLASSPSGRRYDSLIQTVDIDGDGRANLLVPNGFALRLCIRQGAEGGGEPRASNEFYYACPEEPEGAPNLPTKNIVDVQGMYEKGKGNQDISLYKMSALRFVHRTSTTMELVDTNIPGLLNRPNPAWVERTWTGDIYGDGLVDFAFQLGYSFQNPPASVLNYAPYGPACLPTEVYLSTGVCDFPTAQFTNPDSRRIFIVENRGTGHRGVHLPPFAPELMHYARDGLDREAKWEYFPLSSNAGRGTSWFTRPFYSIPSRESGSGYIDAEHFYFTSSMNAVESFSTTNGTGHFRTATFSYTEAMYNNRGRGFQGFRTIVEDRIGWSTTPHRNETWFHQKFPLTGLIERSELRLQFEVEGTLPPIEASTFQYGLAPLTQLPSPPNRWHPYLQKKVTETRNLGNATDGRPLHTRITLLVDDIDAYGNVREQRQITEDGAADCTNPPACPNPLFARRTQTTINTWTPNTADWWINRLHSSQETKDVQWFRPPVVPGPHAQVVTTTLGYDQSAPHRKPEFIQQVGSGQHNWRRTDYIYDQWGNVSSERLYGAYIEAANAREVATSYSGSQGYFPVTISNALGHTITNTFDPRFGAVLIQVDANNLNTTTTLDAYGLPRSVQAPGVPTRFTGMQWCSATYSCSDINRAVYRQETRQDGTPTSIVYFDLLGREVGTETRGLEAQNTWVRTLREYQPMGAVYRESAPHFPGSTIHWTTNSQYDALGRVRVRSTPTPQGQRTTRYYYDGLTTTIEATAPLSDQPLLEMQRTYTSDGWLLDTVDADGGEVDYRYDGAGNLIYIRDPIEATITATYDGLGQRTEMNDPNRGTWTFLYNAAGDLLSQKDGRGWELNWNYDRLGRKTEEFEWRHDEPGWNSRRRLHQWIYDPVNGIGQLHQSRRSNPAQPSQTSEDLYVQTFHYDVLSRPSHEQVHIKERRHPARPGNTNSCGETGGSWTCNPWAIDTLFEQRWGYDAHHGWIKQHYRGVADGSAAVGGHTQYFLHDRYGHRIEEGSLHAWRPDPAQRRYGRQIAELDAFGNVRQQWLGNRAQVSDTPGRQTDTYAPQTGQLLSRCVGRQGGACTVLNLSYTYDGWGNLKTQQETVAANGRQETFVYDSLHRLTQAHRQGLPALPAVTYGYDPAGNLRHKSDYSQLSTGPLPHQSAYQYTSGRPHAVSQVQLAAAGNQIALFEYDGNGNQIERRNGSSTVTRAIRYDVHNLPVRVRPWLHDSEYLSGTIEFRYAPSGKRYIQRNYDELCSGAYSDNCTATNVTLYPFDGYEVQARILLNGSTNLAGWTRARQYLGDYGLRISDLSASLPLMYWIHRDRLGSTAAKTRQDGTIATTSHQHPERHGFDAFGKPRTGGWMDSGPAHMPGGGGNLSSSYTPRGFTDHEHLDIYKLIHMNGRAYDPLLGRFLGVDPIIQFPTNSQSLNPYSYILNNPMAGTDPTGYSACKAGDSVDRCTKGLGEGEKRSIRETPTGSHISREVGTATGLGGGAVLVSATGGGQAIITGMNGNNSRQGVQQRSVSDGRDSTRLGRNEREHSLTRREQRRLDRGIKRWRRAGGEDAASMWAYEGTPSSSVNYDCELCYVDGTWDAKNDAFDRMTAEQYEQYSQVSRNGAVAVVVTGSGAIVVRAGMVGASYVWRNINFDGPDRGIRYLNGRIVGVRWKRSQWGIRLDLHPMKGDPTHTPVLHLNIGPLGRGESSHIPIFDPKWFRWRQ